LAWGDENKSIPNRWYSVSLRRAIIPGGGSEPVVLGKGVDDRKKQWQEFKEEETITRNRGVYANS